MKKSYDEERLLAIEISKLRERASDFKSTPKPRAVDSRWRMMVLAGVVFIW